MEINRNKQVKKKEFIIIRKSKLHKKEIDRILDKIRRMVMIV